MADAFKSNWRRVKGESFIDRMLAPSEVEHYSRVSRTTSALEEFEFRSQGGYFDFRASTLCSKWISR